MRKKSIVRPVAVVAVALSIITFIGCDSEETTEIDPIEDLTNITSDIEESITLSSDTYISGEIHVKSGAVLTIEEGVTVTANASKLTYLLVEQGAKIEAVGTSDSPIIFTSDSEVEGAWGGIHICGKAPINSGETGTSEIGSAIYGGAVSDDDSGTLKYVRIEYSGTVLDDTHEANGLSLYGVGYGTELDYIQIYIGKDDGIELFGGTVDIKHAYVYGAGDDSFDWTEGWCGYGQYLIAEQISLTGDRGIEGDNLKSDNSAAPFANPTLSQVTLIGNGSEGNYGMKLREGTKGVIVNFVVSNFAKRSIDIEHEQTLVNLNGGELYLDYGYVNSEVSDVAINYSASTDEDGNSIGDVTEPLDGKRVEDSESISLQNLVTDGVTKETTYSGGTLISELDLDLDRIDFFTEDATIGAGVEWMSGSWIK